MSEKFTSFVIYLLGFSTIVGVFCFGFLNVSYIFFMIAVFAMATLVIFMDPISFKTKFSFPKYALFFALFAIYTVISDVQIAGQPITLKYLYSNEYLGCLFALFVIENYRNYNPKILNALHYVLIITIIVAVIVILVQQTFDESFFVSKERLKSESFRLDYDAFRLPSIFSWTSNLDIGLVFVPILSLVIGNILYKRGKSAPFFLLLGAIVVFLSRNRWIMLNYFLLFFMYLTYSKVSIKNYLKYVIVIVMTLVISLSFLNIANIPVGDIIDNRILEKSSGGLSAGSAGSRIVAVQVFAKLFPEHMVFGKGMLHRFEGESKDYELVRQLHDRSSQIHVGYLSLLYYYGILGGLLYLTFIVLIIRKLYRDAKITSQWGPFFGFLGFIFANLTLVSLAFFNAGLLLCLFFNQVYLNRQKHLLELQT
jgi:hypothetical protein